MEFLIDSSEIVDLFNLKKVLSERKLASSLLGKFKINSAAEKQLKRMLAYKGYKLIKSKSRSHIDYKIILVGVPDTYPCTIAKSFFRGGHCNYTRRCANAMPQRGLKRCELAREVR